MKTYYSSQEEYLRQQEEAEKSSNGYNKACTHPPIYCAETGKIYWSYVAAAEDTGCSRWGVRRVCEGIQADTHGFHFWYDDQFAEGLIDAMVFPYMEL